MRTDNLIRFIILAMGAACLFAGSADAALEDFEDLDCGLVVAGRTPDGGVAPTDLFEDFVLTVDNAGAGPQSLVVSDPAALYSLRYGPGMPVATDDGVPYRGDEWKPWNLPVGQYLVVADNLVDASPADGLVDAPTGSPDGGMIRFQFRFPVEVTHVVLAGAAGSPVEFKVRIDGVVVVPEVISDPGDPSRQVIDLASFQNVTSLELHLAGSGGVAEIGYVSMAVGNETAAWGTIKSTYR